MGFGFNWGNEYWQEDMEEDMDKEERYAPSDDDESYMDDRSNYLSKMDKFNRIRQHEDAILDLETRLEDPNTPPYEIANIKKEMGYHRSAIGKLRNR